MTKKTGSRKTTQSLVSEWTASRDQIPPANEGELWIGRHAVDQDLLVYDPGGSRPPSDTVSFYSLAQHRPRTFPRAVVLARIQALEDELGRHRARRDYENRESLRQAQVDAAGVAQVERAQRQKGNVLAAHRRYIAALGLEYHGVVPTESVARPRRRAKCHACGIALDDFASAVCGGCNGVLCSCGTCACVESRAVAEEDASR